MILCWFHVFNVVENPDNLGCLTPKMHSPPKKNSGVLVTNTFIGSENIRQL